MSPELIVLGAGGRTGRAVVDQAVERGWQVLACDVREQTARPGVEHRTTSVDDPALVEELRGSRAPIVSALGPTEGGGGERIGNALAALLPGAAGRRVVWVLGAAVPLPQDDRGVFYSFMTRTLGRRRDPAFLEKVRELSMLQASDAAWTAARPPRLRDSGRAGDYAAGAVPLRILSALGRGTLARFLLDCVEQDLHVGSAPIVVDKRPPGLAGPRPSNARADRSAGRNPPRA